MDLPGPVAEVYWQGALLTIEGQIETPPDQAAFPIGDTIVIRIHNEARWIEEGSLVIYPWNEELVWNTSEPPNLGGEWTPNAYQMWIEEYDYTRGWIYEEDETRIWWLFTLKIRENLVKKYFNPLKPDSARVVYELLPMQYADPDVAPNPIAMQVEVRDCDSNVVYGPTELSYSNQKSQVCWWNGKDNAGKYTDPEKSPYLVSLILTYEQTKQEQGQVRRNTKTTNTPIGAVCVVSSKNGEMSTDVNKIVAFEDEVILYGVIKAKMQDEPEEYKYYLGYTGDDLPAQVKINDNIINLDRWDKNLWGELELEWQTIKPWPKHTSGISNIPNLPGYGGYTNVNENGVWLGENGYYGKLVDEGNGYDIIEYIHENKGNEWSIKNEDSKVEEVGTQHYVFGMNFIKEELKMTKFIYSSGEKYEADPPKEAYSHLVFKDNLIPNAEVAYDHGIKANVHRLSRRSNHPCLYIQSIESYLKVPWIWGSAPEDYTSNQAERYVGFDCSDLLVGAYRMMGCIPDPNIYGDVNMLKEQTEPRGDWGGNNYHLYLDVDEKTIRRVEDNIEVEIPIGQNGILIGDIFLMNIIPNSQYEHSLVLCEDANNDGFLDASDILICAGTGEGVTKRKLQRYSRLQNPDCYFIIRYWSDLSKKGGIK